MKHLLAIATPVVLLAGCVEVVGDKGDSGGGGTTGDPGAGAEPPFVAGLVAAAGGAGSVRLDWFPPAAGFELALFQSDRGDTLYDGAPIAEGLAGDHVVLGGLPAVGALYFGLGVRAIGASGWDPAGVPLAAATGAPVFVDAAASGSGDGSSPSSALNDLFLAIIVASAQGSPVWVKDGTYAVPSLPLLPGVHVAGGFGPTFDLATRDVEARATRIVPGSGEHAFDLGGGEPAAVLDGLLLSGEAGAAIGVDVEESSIELHSVWIDGFADRGIRLRSLATTSEFDVLLARVRASGNGADGLNASGAFDLRVFGSSFDANLQEGMELDDLVALDGRTASLEVLGSRFAGNGAEGLDCDLAAPATGGLGGVFDLAVRASHFEENGADGLLIDYDFESFPTWLGRVAVSECFARANADTGIHIDADSTSEIRIERSLASGNGEDGMWVSSESNAGFALAASSIAAGNQRAGLRASLGNKVVAASHCVFAGNLEAGFASDLVTSSASSCVAWLQPAPWSGVLLDGCVAVDDPAVACFSRVPGVYASVLDRVGTTLTLADAGDLTALEQVELAEDGIVRTVQAVGGDAVVLDSVPAFLRLPALLASFGGSTTVLEDYGLASGSPATGAGMRAPLAPPVDAGPFGAPLPLAPGIALEVAARELHPIATDPSLDQGPGDMSALEVVFSAALDPASATLDRVRVLDAGDAELAISFLVLGDRLIVSPPPAGWGSGPLRLELHRGLASSAGEALGAPLALPILP
jgi:hypothetical protein